MRKGRLQGDKSNPNNRFCSDNNSHGRSSEEALCPSPGWGFWGLIYCL